MTANGVNELYMWLSTSWPLVIKPGASQEWKTAKLKQLYTTFKEYTDSEVIAAFQKWTSENEKYPTVKNIINEIKWAQIRKLGKKADNTVLYTMDKIDADGNEFAVMYNGKTAFTWQEFIDLPCNKDHLDPEEWERRFKLRRKRILYGH